MKRILVTGGCGFIGRHVVQELIEHGYGVCILDALLEQVHGSEAISLPAGAELIKGDVRDRAAVAEALQGVASDVKSGQWNPLSAADESLSPLPTDEEKPVDLASIYALTKYAQERAVLIFGDAYGVDAVALRLFNVFGAGQALSNPYTGVLANFASRLANGQRPMIFEDGEQKRDFVHVRDVARAFRLALEQRQARGHVINIGSGRAYAISEVARLLADAMGVPDHRPEILGKARAGDIRNCFADISKARELLGFEPQHRLEDSLDEFVAWVRNTVAIDRGADMKRELEERGLVS
ncbi:MAG: SDR family NAD(P)-dependent oxidoreductase [Mesorhizobium sp.]|nr:MAG: SDR family NAD(P)-dependent oxidoreductase [Mesorhizobium sp.]